MTGKTYFDSLISKEGESLSHYVHSFESSRDSTTNLKVSKWATAVNITAVVRSQPSIVNETDLGVYEVEVILVLTETGVARFDVLKWNDKYWDVLYSEEVFMKGTRQYYKCTAQRRIEFLGES